MKQDNEMINNAVDQAFETVEANETSTDNKVDDKEPTKPDSDDGAADISEQSAESEGDTEAQPETEEQITDEEAIAESDDQSPTEQVEETVAPPAILSAETKALWSKVPADVQKALAADALRTQQQLSRLANEGTRGKAWETKVNADFETKEALDAHRAQLRLQGIQDEVGELHNYRNWNKVMKHDPLTAIRSLINQFGITKQELDGESFSEESEAAANDPRVDNLIEEMRLEREARASEKANQERVKIQNDVNTWKSGNDKYGKPRADFASNYAPQIDMEFQRLIQEAGQAGIEKSMTQCIDEAFNTVQARVYKQFGYNPQKPVLSKEQQAANLSKVKDAVQVASGAPRSDVITKRPKKQYKNEKDWVNDVVDTAIAKQNSRR